MSGTNKVTTVESNNNKNDQVVNAILRYSESNYVNNTIAAELTTLQTERIKALAEPGYIAFHIRRGDFQQKHTRLPAETIVSYTNHLVPDRAERIAYIATDEGNRSFFAPFFAEYKAVYFLSDLRNNTNMENINQNYIGEYCAMCLVSVI